MSKPPAKISGKQWKLIDMNNNDNQ